MIPFITILSTEVHMATAADLVLAGAVASAGEADLDGVITLAGEAGVVMATAVWAGADYTLLSILHGDGAAAFTEAASMAEVIMVVATGVAATQDAQTVFTALEQVEAVKTPSTEEETTTVADQDLTMQMARL